MENIKFKNGKELSLRQVLRQGLSYFSFIAYHCHNKNIYANNTVLTILITDDIHCEDP